VWGARARPPAKFNPGARNFRAPGPLPAPTPSITGGRRPGLKTIAEAPVTDPVTGV
jgi:hypothetical protein